MLFHISEEPNIQRFEPRVPPNGGKPVVWAIDNAHLHNYLVPRDCPRVSFYAGPETTQADTSRFLGASLAVMALEGAWLDALRSCRLYCYCFSPETFECIDDCAGYFVSHVAVVPIEVRTMLDPMNEILARGVELRLLPTLWPLREAVIASSLRFSIIRMRNARQRASD